MVDFLMISTRSPKRGIIEIYPKFIIGKSNDLMIRGSDFYAIWLDNKKMWSTDEQDVIWLIDHELDLYAEKIKSSCPDDTKITVLHLWDAESGMIDRWHKYCQKQMRDSFHMLDEKIIFSNTSVSKRDYASKQLSYPLEAGDYSSWDKLISSLYSEEERHKIEWAIGSIVSGDSKKIQKFLVFYGASGTGKSTILNIIQQLFEGYYSVFDAKALGQSNSSFALEPFKTNPLVAIQHDGDLSHIEDNTRLNSLVSHELMTVNEKFKSAYANRFKCFLFMGTNKPVKITDAKSGLIRRLIDVSPTGNKIPLREYRQLMKQIPFELGAIASHCLDVYQSDPGRYDDYVPLNMLGASNDFYNFILDSYFMFEKQDGTTLKAAWELYRKYCEEAKVAYPYSQRLFKEELKNYFNNFEERRTMEDGTRVRNYYQGFKRNIFHEKELEPTPVDEQILVLDSTKSLFDKEFATCPAQYANENETPEKKWDEVQTTLSELNTKKLHYVKIPKNLIVIDFDLRGEDGAKSLERNLKEAAKWPLTYSELSKSGAGVHLHYYYNGDVSKLARIYDEHIEIKVFKGKSSLRRKLIKCNKAPIATINSGLPLKGETKMVNMNAVQNEKQIRSRIAKALRKEIHANTKPNIDFIAMVLETAYNNGIHYDVTDMRNAVLEYATKSTNQSEYCVKKVASMPFKSQEASESVSINDDIEIVFFDLEVYPNLLLVNYKKRGAGNPVIRMFNPTADEIKDLLKYNLIGFNCRRYDNHILYARAFREYTVEQLYKLSQKIISESDDKPYFREAYALSYTDVYDFCSKKQSLKKWEIELGISHKEIGIPWDQPVPKDKWTEVAEYCDNDVLATEAVFEARRADFIAREILADLAGMTVNDTTNALTERFIFGTNRAPQNQFNYRNLADESDMIPFTFVDDDWARFDSQNRPVFPGYVYNFGVSTYRGEEIGEGGYVYAEPGMYTDVALLDIASMHPSSIVAEQLFGEQFTKRFQEILNARIAIKHKDFDTARSMLNGALAKYLTDESTADALAGALKIAINSVYGLTAARFSNPFRDPRNVDNIVAKRGALFMVNLKNYVQSKGYTVAHIKTDSIKIPNATTDIIRLITEYGALYGYTFEHEATYDRMCLVNDAVYIAKFATEEQCNALYGAEYVTSSKDCCKDCKKHGGEWKATGTQFQIPYVFKSLFSKENIVFNDLCEAKAVSSAIYLDFNELCNENEHDYRFVGKVGRFCPVKPGTGGAELMRESINKETGEKSYYYVTGTKGWRWMEADLFGAGDNLNWKDLIDFDYFNKMVNDAVDTISKYGDYEWFIEESETKDSKTDFDVR